MVTVTTQNFQEVVEKSEQPILMDVWADWCPPCRMMEPIMQELDKDLAGKLVIAKLNADEQAGLAQQLGVMSLPTFLMIKGGKVVHASIGAKPKDALMAEVTQALGVKAARP